MAEAHDPPLRLLSGPLPADAEALFRELIAEVHDLKARVAMLEARPTIFPPPVRPQPQPLGPLFRITYLKATSVGDHTHTIPARWAVTGDGFSP